jgi:hypothetical protein
VTSGLYQRLVARASGKCECGCGTNISPAEADHVFGRAKSEESEQTVWLLSPSCHYAKTRNHPDASTWLRRFIVHAKQHGYTKSLERAEARLLFVDTRRALGARL